MRPLLNTAIQAACSVGQQLSQWFTRRENMTVLQQKGAKDFQSSADLWAEEKLVEFLHKAYPDIGILAEERGIYHHHTSDYWVIDPLDGTTNFLRGYPHFCISIALVQKQQTVLAVVYDPLRQELFTAMRGQGAYLNETRLRLHSKPVLQTHLLTALHPIFLQEWSAEFDNFSLRRSGSVVLDLSYVAANRLDLFAELQLAPWDIAAGLLLIREAGGLITPETLALNARHNVMAGTMKAFENAAHAWKKITQV